MRESRVGQAFSDVSDDRGSENIMHGISFTDFLCCVDFMVIIVGI